MNVDAEIYLKQLFGFFDNNPNELKSLIGDLNKGTFYQKIRDKVYKNIEDEIGDFILTKVEMAQLIKELFDEAKPNLSSNSDEITVKIEGVFLKSNFGLISLN